MAASPQKNKVDSDSSARTLEALLVWILCVQSTAVQQYSSRSFRSSHSRHNRIHRVKFCLATSFSRCFGFSGGGESGVSSSILLFLKKAQLISAQLCSFILHDAVRWSSIVVSYSMIEYWILDPTVVRLSPTNSTLVLVPGTSTVPYDKRLFFV